MVRYIRQRDKFRCGPVAVVNARKWRGECATYDDVLKLSKRWGLSRQALASDKLVQKALRIRGKILTESEVRSAVAAGHAVVVSTLYAVDDQLRGHTWFCPGFVTFEGKPAGYFGVGVFEGESRSLVSWADMERMLRLGFVWVIRRSCR